VNDAELLARARNGDAEAFGDLVDRHRGAVHRAALAALGGGTEADDVAQEAFLLAHRRLATFRGESSFRTWLVRIAWRRALNRRRVAWLRRFVSADALRETGWEPADPGNSAEAGLLDRELLEQVRRLISALPSGLRDPLLLQATGDHTVEEIGVTLGIPAGTVKYRVFEARRRLRERLSRLGYADE